MSPASACQTGSGTQSNMNEVLANRSSELLGAVRGMKRRVHHNDEVNLGQSSNDMFSTAMYVVAAIGIHNQLLPALRMLRNRLAEKSAAFECVIKISRTYLQDAQLKLALKDACSPDSQHRPHILAKRMRYGIGVTRDVMQAGTLVARLEVDRGLVEFLRGVALINTKKCL